MTYKELDMSHDKDSYFCQIIKIELYGKVTVHYIRGISRRIAEMNLCKTDWFKNSTRRIVNRETNIS